MKLFISLIFCLFVAKIESSLIGDFIEGAKKLFPYQNALTVEKKSAKLPTIQYELPTENEEFLKEALALINAPREALDVCTHRVVMTLKKNCNQLNMEELGKLAVMMLNCQLEIEGRETFSCKPEMTLNQCTIGMNAQMHQIYNYMLHRVTGVCSALKQDHFRAVSEMTVNRLLEATRAQVAAIQEALKNQKRLNEMEQENIKEVIENHEKISETQVESLEKLKRAEIMIEENLMNLQHELELRKQSEEKLNEIADSASALQEGHDKLLKHVEELSMNLQRSNSEILQQYNSTLQFIASFKSVMLLLSSIAESIKNYIDNVFYVLKEIGVDVTQEFIVFMFLNLIYFMSGMIFMLFINVQEISSKFVLIALFIFNSFAAYTKTDLDLCPLNVLVWFSFIVVKLLPLFKSWLLTFFTFVRKLFRKIKEMISNAFAKFIKFLIKVNKKKKSRTPDESESDSHSEVEDQQQKSVPTPMKRKFEPQIKIPPSYVQKSSEDNEITEIFNNSHSMRRPTTPVVLPTRAMTPTLLRVMSQDISPAIRAATPTRSATPFQANMVGRTQCQGLTAKGLQCRNAAVAGFSKCRIHNFN